MEHTPIQSDQPEMVYQQRISFFDMPPSDRPVEGGTFFITPPKRPVEGCTVFVIDPASRLEAQDDVWQDAGQASGMLGAASLDAEAVIVTAE